MGFFSWKTSDTKESISNKYSDKGALPVYLLCPDGTKLFENNYEGYGVFAGQDAYALLARWNVPDKCTGDVEHDRNIGIYLEDDEIKFPLKFVEDGTLKYNFVAASEECEYQGYFYPNEDEEDDYDDYDDCDIPINWDYYEDYQDESDE